MQHESTENWIDHIMNKAIENYNGRELVIWGKYGVSDYIKDGLKEKYGIDIAFYVDSDIRKIDGKKTFSPEHLYGKSDKYYVIIPIAFYPSIKQKLTGGGYEPASDYYYFCDCILRQEPDYYEDAHGNKIIGNYQGLKFAFSGFHSVIEIGKNVQFQNTVFYVHNDSEITIGNDVRFRENVFNIHNRSKIIIGDNVQFVHNKMDSCCSSEAFFGNAVYLKQNNIVIGDAAKLEIGNECNINALSLNEKNGAEVVLGEKVSVSFNTNRNTEWIIDKSAKFMVGSEGRFSGQAGSCTLGENALLRIGTEFSTNGNYRISLYPSTTTFIGDDCMFSHDICMRNNDGHSIFDVMSRKNISSCNHISENRSIVIGNHVWVGERAYILYNTRIGDGSIVGAMCFMKNIVVSNNCIVAGIPAKVIKENIAWSREYGAEDITKCGQKYIHYTEK